MIQGAVNSNSEATIRLLVRGQFGSEQEVEAIIDTGFNGFLTLPPDVIEKLHLPFLGHGKAILADGRKHVFEIYEATVVWDGHARNVELDAADTDVLIGMALLRGFHLAIDITDEGIVTIQALS